MPRIESWRAVFGEASFGALVLTNLGSTAQASGATLPLSHLRHVVQVLVNAFHHLHAGGNAVHYHGRHHRIYLPGNALNPPLVPDMAS